jgi:hypothetical protein
MTYKKHKKDICNRGAFNAFLRDPFESSQSQKYLKNFFEVYEAKKYRNRNIEKIHSDSGELLNIIFKRKNNNRKRFCQKSANKKDRLYAKQYIQRGEFCGSTIKTHACSKTIAWCVD